MKNIKKIANGDAVKIGEKEFFVNKFQTDELNIVDILIANVQSKFYSKFNGVEYSAESLIVFLNECFIECVENLLGFKLRLKSLLEINTGDKVDDLNDDELVLLAYKIIQKNGDDFLGKLEQKAKRQALLAKSMAS